MLGSTLLQNLMILTFLLQKWQPFQYNVKFQTKTSFIIILTFHYKILRFILASSILSTSTSSNLLLVKWRPSQCNIKIEKKTSLTVVFTSLLWKIFYKNHYFFNSYFPFQGIILCWVLKSQKFCYLNDGPINIMQNVKRRLVLLLFSLDFYVKLYEGTINFQYIFLKLISWSRIFSSFMISNLLVLKWRPFQFGKKIGKKPNFLMFSQSFC